MAASTQAAARPRIATISGVAIRPGDSKNDRRYTAEALQRAHARLAQRLADPNGRPVVMRSHHPGSKSDLAVTNIAGRLTSVGLDESGAIVYTADIPDTAAGRDVAALVVPASDGAAYLRNVSIRGWWVGDPTVTVDGLESGTDLEIDGLDFTPNPGVDGATITAGAYEAADPDMAEAAAGRRLITESVEDPSVTTAAEAAPARYADPGYRPDNTRRFPMGTKAQVLVGLAHLAETANHDGYTPAQVRRMKGKLRSALREHGVNLASRESLAETAQELVDEAYASVNLDNGTGDIRVSGWVNDPTDLPVAGQRIALAALAALAALDPDNDGDIDFADTDTESATDPSSAAVAEANTKEAPTMETTEATTATTEETTTEAATAAETTTTEETAATTAATPAISEDAQRAIVAQVVEALKADTTTTETEAPTEAQLAETFKLGVIEGVQAAKGEFEGKVAEMRDEIVALYRTGGRKGLIKTDESDQAAKPLHEMSREELDAHAASVWSSVMPVRR